MAFRIAYSISQVTRVFSGSLQSSSEADSVERGGTAY